MGSDPRSVQHQAERFTRLQQQPLRQGAVMNRTEINHAMITFMWVIALLAVGLQAAHAELPLQGYLVNPQERVVLNNHQECWRVLSPASGRHPICDGHPDSDGDGVPDYRDRCPDTPAGVLVDEHGCPLDSDGDGVPDYRDRCPGTPPGVRVDEHGCPIEEDRVTKAAPDTLLLSVSAEGFDFDKSLLKPYMQHELAAFADRVRGLPGIQRLEIIGHTCSIGTESYNIGLSLRRANAVADFLTRQGIDRSRMIITGRGESEPVADNRTKEGRHRNRRVEVHSR